MVERKINASALPAMKSVGTFDFLVIPSLDRQLAIQLDGLGVRRAS